MRRRSRSCKATCTLTRHRNQWASGEKLGRFREHIYHVRSINSKIHCACALQSLWIPGHRSKNSETTSNLRLDSCTKCSHCIALRCTSTGAMMSGCWMWHRPTMRRSFLARKIQSWSEILSVGSCAHGDGFPRLTPRCWQPLYGSSGPKPTPSSRVSVFT